MSPRAAVAQVDGVWQCGSCHPVSSPGGNCTQFHINLSLSQSCRVRARQSCLKSHCDLCRALLGHSAALCQPFSQPFSRLFQPPEPTDTARKSPIRSDWVPKPIQFLNVLRHRCHHKAQRQKPQLLFMSGRPPSLRALAQAQEQPLLFLLQPRALKGSDNRPGVVWVPLI